MVSTLLRVVLECVASRSARRSFAPQRRPETDTFSSLRIDDTVTRRIALALSAESLNGDEK